MKYLILILLSFIGYSYAELPGVLDDAKTRETAEYLDQKTNSALKVTQNFGNSKSTVTVNGWIDMGMYLSSATATNANEWNISCANGYRAIFCSHIRTTHGNDYGYSSFIDFTDPKKCLVYYSGAATVVAAPMVLCARIK